MTNPVPGFPVTYPYGVKNSDYAAGFHTGDDHACPIGTQVVAPWDSKIVFAGWGSGGWGSAYGYEVIGEAKHKGKTIRWATNHMSHLGVHTGMTVREGDKIGLSGDTGNVTGPHVHYEERTSPFLYNDHCQKPELSDATNDDPASEWASGTVYVRKLKKGTRDSDSVARLCYRLMNHPDMPGSHRPRAQVKGYGEEIVEAVRYWQRNIDKGKTKGPSDGESLSDAQANKLFGPNYLVVDTDPHGARP